MLHGLRIQDAGTGLDVIKAGLVNKIVYIDSAVFMRLGIDQVNRNFVSCFSASESLFSGQNSVLGFVEVAHQYTQWKCTSEHLTCCEYLDLRLYYVVVASKELVFIVEEYMGFIYVST